MSDTLKIPLTFKLLLEQTQFLLWSLARPLVKTSGQILKDLKLTGLDRMLVLMPMLVMSLALQMAHLLQIEFMQLQTLHLYISIETTTFLLMKHLMALP